MRKFILSLLAAVSLPALADNVPGMIVTMSSGTVKEYVISSIDKITYSGSNMVISTTSGSSESISTDDVAKITLSHIIYTATEKVASLDEGTVEYNIYTMDGKFIAKGTTTDVLLPINSLPGGKYIVNIKGISAGHCTSKTIKVVK